MSNYNSGQPPAEALAQAVAQALLAFERAPREPSSRTRLPHPFSNLTRAQWANSINLWRAHGAPLLKSLPARACPTCGGTASDYIFDSYDAYPYHECRACRTWHVPLAVTHELFERYFASVPQARQYGDYTDAQAVNTHALEADNARFSGYYKMLRACLARDEDQAPSTLDIGCGVANSLAVAGGLGFEAEGIEVNQHAVSLARSLSRRVHFPGERSASASFDAVTMWETLEHIADPFAALQTAHTYLKDDGLLALTVPNLNAPDIRSMRGDSLQIHGGPAWPGHINLWTPATLTNLLRRARFEPVHVSGQFSTNLEEFLAYHQGLWSGARDYLRADSPEFDLPAASRQIAQTLGTAAASWQEGFAFAPILVVLARKSDGQPPAGLQAFAENAAAARRSALGQAYGIETRLLTRRMRGAALDLTSAEWMSEASAIEGGRLTLDARGASAFSYLWRSPPLNLAQGGFVRIRGAITTGSFSVGLLQEDAWKAQSALRHAGPFEVSLPAPEGAASRLVFSNNDNGCGPVEAEIDCVELVGPD